MLRDDPPWIRQLVVSFSLFFFFQAEDGIRDRNVTGVQTCALPIYRLELQGRGAHRRAARRARGARAARGPAAPRPEARGGRPARRRRCARLQQPVDRKSVVEGKRGELGGGGMLKNKNYDHKSAYQS